jgi:phosphatidylglycerol---prolipoprotein diacylglyceryl transferase
MLPINIHFWIFQKDNYEGIYFFIGIVFGLIFLIYSCKKDNLNLDLIFEGVFYAFLAAIFFGRMFDFLLWNPEILFTKPLEFFMFTNGGFTVTGAVLGGLASGYIFSKIKKLHFLYLVQYFIIPILIGQIIGRFGCFLNGDGSGIPTNLPWGIVYSHNSLAYSNIMPNTHLHPTQIYEMIGNFILLVFFIFTGKIEWFNIRRLPLYVIGYGLIRFIIENFRSDSSRIVSFLTGGQIISLLGIFAGLSILVWTFFNEDKLIAKPENIAYKK